MLKWHGIFSVDKSEKVNCKQCNHAVWREIHVVEDDNGYSEYGCDCFKRKYGNISLRPTLDISYTAKLRSREEFYELLFNTIEIRKKADGQRAINKKLSAFFDKIIWYPLLNNWLNELRDEEYNKSVNLAKSEFYEHTGIKPEGAGWYGLITLIARDIREGKGIDWSWCVGDKNRTPKQQGVLL